MVKKETLSAGPGGAWVKPLQSEWAGNSSRPKPEEGVRLIHAFRSIKQAALREAIIGQSYQSLTKMVCSS
jgi:hypothetical protein